MFINKLNYFSKICSVPLQSIRSYIKPIKSGIMPKNTDKYIAALQRTRKRLKAQSIKYEPSNIYLQIIGNGSLGEPRSVLLITDHTSYLFNCGEGTQRLASEHGIKLTKIEHMLLTRTVWENMGGIPGMILTLQDIGIPNLKLHGPDGSMDIINGTKNFLTLNKMDVVASDILNPFTDQTMTIDYVPITNPKISDEDKSINNIELNENTNDCDYELNCNGKRFRSPDNSTKIVNNAPKYNKTINTVMNYICKINPSKGTLDLEKCVAAGVQPGPLLGQLKAGKDVKLPDGTIVESKNVVLPSDPGPIFIVLECPDEDWIDAVVQNKNFIKHQYQTASNNNDIARYIIHFTPETVLSNSKYKEWMNKFGPKTEHLIINESNTGISSIALYKMQHQLHILHPSIFPLFTNQLTFTNANSLENNTIQSQTNENTEESSLPINSENVHHCKVLNTVYLRPHHGMKTDSFVAINPKTYVQEIFEIDNFLSTLDDLKVKLSIDAETNSLEDVQEYPRLLMLGTGSSVPNKVRNTSGMLLQIDIDTSILLDCGEGTVNQLIRFFGESAVENVLKTIKAIYISHLHADHHVGLIGVLKQRKRLTNESLFLFAPQSIVIYLNFYDKRFESIQDSYKLISNSEILVDQYMLKPETTKSLCLSLNILSIKTSFVRHCYNAYGVAITLKDGRKISYSGDTIPCDSFIDLCKNSFLLIHEATMEDGLEKDALVKLHSTVSQAINVGVKADVNFTLLTHFSQRYSKIPVLPSEKACSNYNRIGIAYDFMMIKLSQLSILPLFYPCLSVMFSKYRDVIDNRAKKRQFKDLLLQNRAN